MSQNRDSRGGGSGNGTGATTERKEDMIRVDGRGQVLEMLRAADPDFREVLLRGIEKRDAQLARELRRAL